MVLFLCTMQPVLKQVLGPANKTTMLVLAERYHFCDGVAVRSIEWIPVCIDHANMEKLPHVPDGLAVPHNLSIGRLIYAMVRSNGQLLGVGEIYHEQPEARLIVDDINAGTKWGVSLCTNSRITPDWIDVTYKKIIHLGVTKNPEYGEENTWIHLAAVSGDKFYRKLLKKFINVDRGMYVPAAMIEQLEGMLGRGCVLPRKKLGDVSITVGASRELASNPESHLFPAAQNAPPLYSTFFPPSTLPDFSKSPWIAPFHSHRNSPWITQTVKSMATATSNTAAVSAATPSGGGGGGDAMSGVTSTNVTPATNTISSSSPSPATPSQTTTTTPATANFAAMGDEIKQFLKNTMDVSGNPVVGIDTLLKARQYSDSIADMINKSGAGSNVAAWPKDSLHLLNLLGQLQETSKTENQEFAKKVFADNPQLSAVVGRALENPLNPENLAPASLVFAFKPKMEASERERLTNQREQEAIIATRNQELEQSKKREAEKDANVAKLKADMDIMSAKFAEFTKQQQQAAPVNESAAKRFRPDTTPIMNTGLTAEELALAKGQQTSLLDAGGVSVTVGASQGTRSSGFDEAAILASYGSSARLMHSGWVDRINRYAPKPNKSAEVEAYKSKVFYDSVMGNSSAALGSQINQL
jgi:hypothetical protein